MNQQQILNKIKEIRDTQDKKWGTIDTIKHSQVEWLMRLGEEYGEVCEALIRNNKEDTESELLDLIGVSVSWLEHSSQGKNDKI